MILASCIRHLNLSSFFHQSLWFWSIIHMCVLCEQGWVRITFSLFRLARTRLPFSTRSVSDYLGTNLWADSTLHTCMCDHEKRKQGLFVLQFDLCYGALLNNFHFPCAPFLIFKKMLRPCLFLFSLEITKKEVFSQCRDAGWKPTLRSL